jgi:hypothetical protein
MRTLSEIIESVKTNEKPDYEELRYALIAMTYLMNDTSRWYRELLMGKMSPLMIEFMKKENRYGKALAMSPKEYIGWSNDPENPKYQQEHAVFQKIFDKAMKGELPNQKRKQEESK